MEKPSKDTEKREKRVFLGSSRGAISLLDQVAEWIVHAGHTPVPWNETGVFPLGQYLLSVLLQLTKTVDAAVLIFAGDDEVWYREDRVKQPRDNVLIEYGLFAGVLGPDRTIFCVPGSQTRIAVDLQGLRYLDLGERQARCQLEIRKWLNGLADVDDETARRQRTAVTANETIVSGLKVLESQKPGRERADPALDRVVGELQKQVTRHLMEREVGVPSALRHSTRLTINENGDCRCEATRRIKPLYQPQLFIEIWIEGDLKTSVKSMNIEMQCRSPGRIVETFVTEDKPMKKRVLFALRPEIGIDREFDYIVSWTWPGMFKKLAKARPDAWIEEVKSVTPVATAKIRFDLHPALPKIRWDKSKVEHEDGAERILTPPRTAKNGFVQYLCELKNVAPGGRRFEVDLVPY